MKRIFLILSGLAMLFCCTPETGPGGTEGGGNDLTLSEEKLVFSAFGGQKTVEVTCSHDGWVADVNRSDREWLSVSSGDGKITVTVAANTQAAPKTGTVTVSAGDKTATLTVTQEGCDENAADGEETTVSYSLAEGTSIAPKELARHITSVNRSAHTFTVDKDVPAGLLPAVGSKLIINTPTQVLPNGLLATIRDVGQTADGYTVSYEDAGLEVFKSVELNSDGLDLGQYVTSVTDGDGNPVEFTATRAPASKHFHIDISNAGIDLPYGFSLSPKIGVDLTMKIQLVADEGRPVLVDFKIDADVELGAELELAVEAGIDRYKKIRSIYLAAIPVGPVLVTPSIDIFYRFEVSGKISLTASATATVSSSTWLHWDMVNGKNGSFNCDDPDISDCKFEAGAKLEASIAYGLGVGPSIGIFGDVLAAGITLDVQHKETLSAPIDMDTWKNPDPEAWIGSGIDGSEITSSIEVGSTLHFNFLELVEQNVHLPGLSFTLDKYKVFPPVSKDVSVIQESGDVYSFKTKLTGPSLFSGIHGALPGELVVFCYDYTNSSLGTPMVFPFNIDKAKADELWRDRTRMQPIEAKATGLAPGVKYAFSVGWKIGNTLITIFDLPEIRAIRPQDLAALHNILSDIRASASGTWEECNWDDDDLPVNKLKNVDMMWYQGDDTTRVNIIIPPEWKMGKSLSVADRSGGNTFFWDLTLQGDEPRSFNTVSILDKGCKAIWGNCETGTYIFRGVDPGNVTATEKWDVSGCPGVTRLGYAAPVMIADNCPSLHWIEIMVPKGKQLTSFSAKNCTIRTCEMGGEGTISADAIAGMGSVNCSTRILGISRSDMSSINIGSGPTRVDIAGVPSVTVSNATHLKDLTVRKGVSSLSVYDCPALKTFDAEEAESLTAFNVSNLPAITNLTVGYTPKLKSVMPAMFVNMLQDGHSGLGYPIRYDYRTKTIDAEEPPGDGWKMLKKYTGSWVDGEGQVHNDFYASLWYYDRGYGFYFSGEPTRGYHGTTEPPYMDWLWD